MNAEIPNQTIKINRNLDNQQFLREIPYNYTSFTDKEVVNRLLGEDAWTTLEELRAERVTGRSARMLFEMLGNIWVVRRNPYLEDDLIASPKRRQLFEDALSRRLKEIETRADNNPKVLKLLESAKVQVERFKSWLDLTINLREKLLKRLSAVTHKDNIAFDSLSRVSHVTDASDWRVEYPLLVLYPDTIEEISDIVMILKELGITIIPRGGATGYAASGIPLDPLSAMINCEKFDHIGEIKWQNLIGRNDKTPTLYVESGAITKAVMDYADENDLIFAVDPTSASASCIGGNIAMNAGGKKAVLWGTALDNLYSWQLINAHGQLVETTRIDHNLSKIHDAQYATFEVKTYNLKSGKKSEVVKTEIIKTDGYKFRKAGLGKDVTDKFLFGLPGIQKEGCDGFILSGIFILHQLPKYKNTICLEFFGRVDKAVGSIVAIKDFMDNKPEGVVMSGFEHLDARYVKAVGYTSKSAKMRPPRMVLLADIAGEVQQAVSSIAKKMIELAKSHGVSGAVEGFIADTPEKISQFWAERAHTSAISKHTNAFKVNEDVVIPLPRMGEYSDGIEFLNVELSLENKLALCQHLTDFFTNENLPINTKDSIGRSLENNNNLISAEGISSRVQAALTITEKVSSRWQFYLDNLNSTLKDVKDQLTLLEVKAVNSQDYEIDENDTLFRVIQYGGIRASWKEELQLAFAEVFYGHTFLPTLEAITKIHEKVLKGRIFIALHMHAGDGNVHTNIPVNSDNSVMINRAHKAVDAIMEIAKKLGGVISGEHGIGITKIKYLSPQELKPFREYKLKVDPEGVFNRGQLERHDALSIAYTPSFSLIGHESLVLETTALGEISDSIKDCLRCGKCKPVCATHVPRANILYSPRNKILGTSLLTEAILYEGQTRRGVSKTHTDSLNDIAAHCSVCHKCYNPCPVDIDFGEVTAKIRSYLKTNQSSKGTPISWLAMQFLNVSDVRVVKAMRVMMIVMGYPMQRLAYRVFRYLGITGSARKSPRSTTGKVPVQEQLIQFINRPLPAKIPSKTSRTLLNIDDSRLVPIIFDNKKITEQKNLGKEVESVFYFPGCGNEKLFSQVGLATQAMLAYSGVQCVLPPTYLCCGYPQLSAGYSEQSESITTYNRVLFHRIAISLSYLEIKTVVVSCGTCIDQLEKYKFNEIFPGSRLLDIHEFLMEKNILLPDIGDGKSQKYLYHEPCHTPIKLYKSKDVIRKLMGESIIQTPRCCGESGTLAISRPDISNQVRFAKNESIQKALKSINGNVENFSTKKNERVKILTTCPSCLQGLSRYQADAPISADYIVVEMARKILGENWLESFVEQANKDGVEKVLF